MQAQRGGFRSSFEKVSFRTNTFRLRRKIGHALTTARIIFQFVDRRYRIRERLRSRRERMVAILHPTLGEYSDLYLKTDVLLLTVIFENFRNSCVASYYLDPVHYYTLPGFTWDMLKYTHVWFELLINIDIVMFIERDIRDDLSLADTHRLITSTCVRSIHRNRCRT